MTTIRNPRCVFVGNIPYDASEEQLIEIFQEVGPVVSFRLVFDRETGKSKGYGFCEYGDAETALSAMRKEFNGRTLRVDFAENEKASMQQLQAIQSNLAKGLPVTATIPSATSTMNVPQNLSSSRPPTNLPTIPNNSNAPSIPETINSMLDGLNNIQLYDIVSKMKLFIQSNPDQARQLLLSHPPLAYALLQAQALLGMIQIHTVQKILSKNPSTMNIGGTTGISSPIGINSMPTLGVPTVIANPAPAPTPPLIPTMTPTYGGSLFSPGIMPFQTSTPITSLSLTEEQQKQLLQVMSLTQEQIDQLSPEQRQQVQQLRQTFQQNFRF